jgi:predicted PurR-regulated permease PerM
MSAPSDTTPRARLFHDVLETTIRLGLVLVLLAWCFQIVRPFITPVVWGFIIAVAVAPLSRRLTAALGGRRKLAAVILVALGFALFIAPAVRLSGTLIAGLQDLASRLHDGQLRIPPPPQWIADWPVVGDPILEFWNLAINNLEAAVLRLAPQLQVVGGWLLTAAAGVGYGIVQFVFSMIIAGIVIANADRSRGWLEQLMRRLAGAGGHRILVLSESAIRSVAIGIVGVALIQAGLAGAGFYLVGVPGAGFWALLALFLCIIQLGPGLVLLGAVVYVFSTADTLTAVLFLVFSIILGLSDNVLKPLLLGRGVDAPVLVIFIGSLGGFLSMGIIGLFVGSVLFVLFYTLLRSWVNEDLGGPPDAAGVVEKDSGNRDPSRRAGI